MSTTLPRFRLLIASVVFSGFTTGSAAAERPASTQLRLQAERCRELLKTSLVDFYLPASVDWTRGGYMETLDAQGRFDPAGEKFLVMQSRQLWFFSTLAREGVEREQSLKAAKNGFDFLRNRMFDSEHGGYFAKVSAAGTPIDVRKHAYLHSFALYGLVAYFRASGDHAALALAQELFRETEKRMHDEKYGGYWEFFHRDWRRYEDQDARGYIGAIGTKTYNTHLHLLEAFTDLHRVWPDALVRQRLLELIQINTLSVRHPGFHHHVDGWWPDWTMVDTPRNQRASYGHDVECAWLTLEAARVAGLAPAILRNWAETLVGASLQYGYDYQHGGFFYGGPPGQPADDTKKEWWVQAEALVSMLELYRLTGKEDYLKRFDETLRFIERHHIAKEGGWYATRQADGSPLRNSRTSMWQGAYHGGRALMLSARLLDEIAAGTPAAISAAEAPATLVVINGKVLTMDSRDSIAEAVAIRDGRFVYIGDNAGARRLIGKDTRVLDARANSVVPGLFETHVHAIGVARDQLGDPFRQLSSLSEIGAWVRGKVARTQPGEWIRIPRVDLTRLREGRFPTREELDRMEANRPLVFDWSYAGLNQVQVLNTAALAAAGITRHTPDPADGRIVRHADGEPTGMLRNARALIERHLPVAPQPDKGTLLTLLEKVHRHYNMLGITSVTERRTDPEGHALYAELRKNGRLTVRTTITIGVGYQGTGNALRQIANLPFKPGEGDDWLRLGPLKIRVDGGLLYGTAYLREPFLADGSARYYDLPSATNRGELIVNADDIHAIIRAGHKAGWQMSCHVAGDAGVDVVLDALEAANRDSPIAPRRFNLIHAYLPNPETARRAAGLGAVVDTQPVMYYKDGDALAQTLGAERAARVYGLGEWRRAGVKVAINADHMAGLDPELSLNPYSPFLAMYVAVTRKTESGRVHGPEQRVSRLDALRMMTLDAAYLSFDESRRGSIEVGKLADLAILSADFLRCSDEDIKRIKVAATVLDGKVVHE